MLNFQKHLIAEKDVTLIPLIIIYKLYIYIYFLENFLLV